ncbi:hypothetical protein CRE_03218 [Caenorhabditis remanei]|uniref:Uncharacterized protein n=1 Tax=Caenorhabditis remanei TaxID=31234 RepID=E3MME6_CAERE|nr:hypothetical protein CRE_03218 [Caenorhabditis remanei]
MMRFMLGFYIVLFSIPAIARYHSIEDQNTDLTVVQDAGKLHLLHNVDPVVARQNYKAHRYLLNMKRSIAFGRAGFRPGKRTVAINSF